MPLIVQKFGGDALGERSKDGSDNPLDLSGPTLVADKYRHVARIVARTVQTGARVVVCVSAMGDTTNRLLRMANALCDAPPARELDMLLTTGEQVSIALLAMALQAEGVSAVSFTGPQVGIRTDRMFGKSRIKEINSDRLMAALDKGQVPIVAGFQGMTSDMELTTLGRGGSDITAVALAAVLHADACEFYKDVDGIFTTDPRICGTARKIERISYDEMLELASLGAGILHSRSVEFAKNYAVPLHVRSYRHDQPGTMVLPEDSYMEDVVVSGVAFNRDEAQFTLKGVPDKPGTAAKVFSRLGEEEIVVDMIIQNDPQGGKNNISFTVSKNDIPRARGVVQQLAEELGADEMKCDENIAKVSAVGVGMRSHSDVAARMFRALADAGINIRMISTSEIKISVVIEESDMAEAVRAVHRCFEDQTDFALKRSELRAG